MIKKYAEWINESLENPKLTLEQEEWCNNHIRGMSNFRIKWWVNDEGEVKVVGYSLIITPGSFTRFPVKFADLEGYFSCDNCTNLTSLEGAPSVVKSAFSCNGCISITSLKGVPRKIDSNFHCDGCTSLTSLEGAPSSVELDFTCRDSVNLTSFKGAPSQIGKGFYYEGCPKVPVEEKNFYENIPDLFFDWLKTGLSFKEYQAKYKGKITGSKFGL